MHRRTVLAGSAGTLASLAGCARDMNNESQITIKASEAACGEGDVDVDFDDQSHSQGMERKLDAIVEAGQYTDTPPYDTATEDIYEILQMSLDGGRGTILHDSTCYGVSIQRIYDD